MNLGPVALVLGFWLVLLHLSIKFVFKLLVLFLKSVNQRLLSAVLGNQISVHLMNFFSFNKSLLHILALLFHDRMFFSLLLE